MTYDNEFGPGVRTVRHNPTVPAGRVAALRALLGHALTRLWAAWDALVAPETAADPADDTDIPPAPTDSERP